MESKQAISPVYRAQPSKYLFNIEFINKVSFHKIPSFLQPISRFKKFAEQQKECASRGEKKEHSAMFTRLSKNRVNKRI
jgi:hypothetical protein